MIRRPAGPRWFHRLSDHPPESRVCRVIDLAAERARRRPELVDVEQLRFELDEAAS